MREGGFEPPQVLPNKILSSFFRLGSRQLPSRGVKNPSLFLYQARDLASSHVTSWRLRGDPVGHPAPRRVRRRSTGPGCGVIRALAAAGLPLSRVRLRAIRHSRGQPSCCRLREDVRSGLPRRSWRRSAGALRGLAMLRAVSEQQTRISPSFKSPFVIGNHPTARPSEQRAPRAPRSQAACNARRSPSARRLTPQDTGYTVWERT
jgi:hypothetical protein